MISRWIRIVGIGLVMALIVIASTAAGSGDDAAGGPVSFLTGPAGGDPLDIALGYVSGHLDSLALAEEDIAGAAVSDRYASQRSGITHIYLQQRYAGIDIYNAIMNINIAADGSVINVGNRFVPNLSEAVNTTKAVLGPGEAVQAAASSLGLTLSESLTILQSSAGTDRGVLFSDGGVSLEPIPARLVYQPMTDGTVRLAWEVSIYELDAQNWWSQRIDAVTGKELERTNYVVHDNFGGSGEAAASSTFASGQGAPGESPTAADEYRVYAEPAESPIHVVPLPPADGRVLMVNPADSTASPFGWHDTNGAPGAEFTITQGNNANAYTDTDNNNVPDPGSQPDGGASLVFDFPIDLTQDPSTYKPAAVTNLFYWNNLVHDVFYHYGFDEPAGNFQENNYGNGGSGSDSVNAEAQDGGGTNNANFATPSDGFNPRMQMYLWNLTSPRRDGDFDNGIIVHEYGHGISNRLTGGPNNVGCLNNQEQAGEGWSDYLALIMTIEAGDQGTDRRGIGTYALGEPTTGDGIRDYPYSTDMAIDPRTYNEIKTAAVPHGVGSTWAAMVWEMTWALIDQYGFDPNLIGGTGGNNIAAQLVIDGMKLQPCSPGFVDARDAILLADQNNNGGANQCLIWEAFAKRGLGYSADQGSSANRSDGTEAFDLPLSCTQNLKITKSANPDPVDAGSNLTYSLLVENNTSGSLTGVTITDNVPADTTYVPGSADCGGSESGGVVTFPLGTMAAGANQTCTFQVAVSSGLGTVVAFSDDMESGSGSWTASHGSGSFDWSLGTANANSPTHAWYAQDVASVTDQYLSMTNSVTLSGQPLLRFWHHYNTEASFDGGVVEISAGGGPWTDLGSLITQNGYNSAISSSYGNPIGGRQAFSGSSGGYVETLVDLSGYVGSNVQIRFRLGTDTSVASDGWYVDDVEIIDEDTVTNTACVTANEGDNDCDTVTTVVNPGQTPTDPAIYVTPASLSANQNVDETSNQTLTVGNSGGQDLIWTINESTDACTSTTDIAWVSASPAGGTTIPAGSDDVTVTFDSTGQAVGTYLGSLCVSSNDPFNGTIEVPLTLTVEDPSTPVDQFADGDIPIAGTAVGTYADTHDNDGLAQTITERESGGKPSNRHDYLEHKWTFQVQPGSVHTFFVNAWRTEMGDGDNFVFAFSTDDVSYADLVTVDTASDGTTFSASLPAYVSGTVYIRVKDTDQTQGQKNFDTVYVDQMVIQTVPGDPPPSVVMHVGDLDGSSSTAPRSKWVAIVTVTVHDAGDNPVAGATVTGSWSDGASGSGTCVTDAAGQCTIEKGNIKSNVSSATFTVTNVTRPGDTYNSGVNHDPDGDSTGTVIVVVAP